VALYLDHFGLEEPPFRITPHPDFFFDGADRGATLEGLLYAILHDEGIVKVSGEIGSGKTTLCRVMIERLPAEVETVFLANPSYSRSEILQAIAEELGLPAGREPAVPALRALQEKLLELYAAGRRVVVMIDEAHAMPEDALEQVRLLSNLESSRHKLLQIVLFGQPELDEALAKPSMRQLKDRITHNFRTRPLVGDEVAKYVAFRMRAAGYKGPDVFSPSAIAAITRLSGGLTRRINVLCDKSLLAAFAANSHAVTPREVRVAHADSDFAALKSTRPRIGRAVAAAALLACGAALGAGLYYWLSLEERKPPPPAAVPESAKTPAANVPAQAASPTPPVAEPQRTEPPAAEPDRSGPPADKPEPPPTLTAEQLRRFEGYLPGRNPLLRERLAATRAWLQEPQAAFTVELFVADNSDPMRTERFLLRARDLVPLRDVFVVPVASGARYRLLVAYGAFADRETATEAARRLPPKYQKAFQLETRSLSEVRSLI
jgi:type II secretory pathway predicted ATPase ExeA